MTLLDLAFELRLITRFGPAYFRGAVYPDECDQEQHEKGAERHALLFILWEVIEPLL
jgi:hypothetical protein